MASRTNQEIIDQTNLLARQFYLLRGYEVPEGFRFDEQSEASHPHEIQAWQQACFAQEELTGTDVEDVLSDMEDSTDEHSPS